MKDTDLNIGFVRGYVCAVANIMRTHGEDTIAEDVYNCSFLTITELRKYGVDEYDIETLKPIIKEINRKNRLEKNWNKF